MTDFHWDPIETAPRDGTWILVDNAKYDHPFIAKWEEYRGRGVWIQDNPGIYDDGLGYWEPTHWAPCPRAQQ